jgi:sec-independent protein translocase protein TatC
MPFLDHLEELRWRLLKSLAAILLGTIIGWFVVERFDVIGLLMRPIAPHLPGGRLNFTSPTDPFFITLKFAFIVGLVACSPYVIYQIWAFLAPALYEKERRLVIPALVVGLLLFVAGAAGGYFLVLPRALKVLLGFQSQALQPIITADRYFGFAAQIILAFGIITELPLVIVLLTSLGIVNPTFLRRNRRWALLIAATLAAFLTPPDALSMILMMLPLLLLYEIGIWCSWVITRRRAKAAAQIGAVAGALLLAGGLWRPAQAQNPQSPIDTTRRNAAADSLARGRPIDTAAARLMGLPTGPSRTFPATDPVMDSLLKLTKYRITHYMGDTLLLQGDSQTIYLRGAAFVDREGTKLEADSVKYRQATCRLDATGNPHLFDQATVLAGEGMRYDTCIKRGSVTEALTDFQQAGQTWYMRARGMAVDSGSTRLYGARSDITSCNNPVPHYHFAAREVKWLNKDVMVARPAVLYIQDVPIIWLPFIFNDIRPGRRSGVLVPGFGLNDLVRPTRSYQRHVTNIGYYLVLNDYVDMEAAADWNAGRSLSLHARTQYRWLDRFVNGSLYYSQVSELDHPAHSSQLIWNHTQSFDARTRFSASVNYITSGFVVQRNTINPELTNAQFGSHVDFSKTFNWGTLNVGGSRSQNTQNNLVSQTIPTVSITPAPVNLAGWLTWSPGITYTTNQTFHNPGTPLLLPPGPGDSVPDTLPVSFDVRQTNISVRTPLRLGRWNWDNSITVSDNASNQRAEFTLPDSTDPTGVRRVVYNHTFSTLVDWNTGINLPSFFSGTWRLQPGISIVNRTSAGQFMVRNQFTGGRFVQQGKRLQFGLGIAPTFFGFFPGIGPFSRIRHSVSFVASYQYAPGSKVPDEFAHAIDPTGRLFNAKSDPQQTISLGLQQVIEAKLRPPAGDTTGREPRKIRLLSINTSAFAYNFEQAKVDSLRGWTTQSVTNSFASDLLPGFDISMTHDLWRGPVQLRSSKFDPFLTSLSARFAISGKTLEALGGLIGLGGHGGPPSGPTPPAAGPQPGGPPGEPMNPAPRGMRGYQGGYGGSGGRGFNLSVTFSTTRQRDSLGNVARATGFGGRNQMGLGMSFSPTRYWTAQWRTNYDFDTQRFADHYLSLNRELHDWRASFAFTRTATGNFAFTFYVALIAEPDIKFDYDQQSFRR